VKVEVAVVAVDAGLYSAAAEAEQALLVGSIGNGQTS